jgi:hypothetical protein
MTNASLLSERIKKSGYKVGYVAQCLGITRQSLHSKINNHVEFKASEIDTLCNLLCLGVSDRMAIFFAKSVD